MDAIDCAARLMMPRPVAFCFALAAAVTASPWAAVSAPAVDPAPQSASPRSNAPPSPPAPNAGSDYAFQPLVRCPFCPASAAHPQGRYGLHWHEHWRRVGLFEYVLTPTFLATAAVVWFGIVPEAHEAAWTGPILFDSAARRSLEMKTRSGRTAAGTLSSTFLYGSIAQTVAFDSLFVAWALRAKPDVAWQTLVIDSQAYAMTLALTAVTKRITARQRPFGEKCGSDGNEFDCKTSNQYQSFYSGHAALSATAAGLVCAHHAELRLYANPYADAAACGSSVALALATGGLRIASENHWASDVLAGELIGFLSGYVLPRLVYYREARARPDGRTPESEPRMALVPLATAESLQVAAAGVF